MLCVPQASDRLNLALARRKYEDLDAKIRTEEGDWRQYNDASVGVAEELCGRTSGKGGTSRSRNQGWWTEEVAKAVGGGRSGKHGR